MFITWVRACLCVCGHSSLTWIVCFQREMITECLSLGPFTSLCGHFADIWSRLLLIRLWRFSVSLWSFWIAVHLRFLSLCGIFWFCYFCFVLLCVSTFVATFCFTIVLRLRVLTSCGRFCFYFSLYCPCTVHVQQSISWCVYESLVCGDLDWVDWAKFCVEYFEN